VSLSSAKPEFKYGIKDLKGKSKKIKILKTISY
jgi:hypothetical protein